MPAQRTRDNQSSRSLDVTDGPSPSPSIVSPKPIAFAYPEQHNLNASPSSSRSCSPEPTDLQFTDPFSQFSMVPIPTHPNPLPSTSSSPAPSMKRRKSSAAAGGGSSSPVDEHRPKKGDPDYIKRPENAFIHFRRHCVAELQKELEASGADASVKKKRQADLSKEISKRWRELSAEEGQVWKDMAAQSKKDHLEKYPNYVYRPQRNKEKERAKKMSLASSSSSSSCSKRKEEPTISFVVPLPAPRGPRRPSAPTPPPYQSITIPQVVHRLHEPESPSDSLVHCISRVSTSNSVAGNMFDFIPQNAYVAPPFLGTVPQIQSMQPDFMRTLFQQPPPPQNRVQGPSPLERLAMEMDVSSFSSLQSPSSSTTQRGPLAFSSASSSPDSPMGPITPPTPSFDGLHAFSNGASSPFDTSSTASPEPSTTTNNNNGPNGNNGNWSFTLPEPFDMQMLHFPETEADLALKELEASGGMGMGTMGGMNGMGMYPFSVDSFSSEGLKDLQGLSLSSMSMKDDAQYMPPIQWGWDQSAILDMDNNWDVESVPSVLMGEEALAAMHSGATTTFTSGNPHTQSGGAGAHCGKTGSTSKEAPKRDETSDDGIRFEEFSRIAFGVGGVGVAAA